MRGSLLLLVFAILTSGGWQVSGQSTPQTNSSPTPPLSSASSSNNSASLVDPSVFGGNSSSSQLPGGSTGSNATVTSYDAKSTDNPLWNQFLEQLALQTNRNLADLKMAALNDPTIGAMWDVFAQTFSTGQALPAYNGGTGSASPGSSGGSAGIANSGAGTGLVGQAAVQDMPSANPAVNMDWFDPYFKSPSASSAVSSPLTGSLFNLPISPYGPAQYSPNPFYLQSQPLTGYSQLSNLAFPSQNMQNSLMNYNTIKPNSGTKPPNTGQQQQQQQQQVAVSQDPNPVFGLAEQLYTLLSSALAAEMSPTNNSVPQVPPARTTQQITPPKPDVKLPDASWTFDSNAQQALLQNASQSKVLVSGPTRDQLTKSLMSLLDVSNKPTSAFQPKSTSSGGTSASSLRIPQPSPVQKPLPPPNVPPLSTAGVQASQNSVSTPNPGPPVNNSRNVVADALKPLAFHYESLFNARASRELGCRRITELIEIELLPGMEFGCTRLCPAPAYVGKRFGVICLCCPMYVSDSAIGAISLMQRGSYMADGVPTV